MKLRLHNNSVRFRLSQTEVKMLAESGIVEEAVDLTPSPLVYLVHASKDCRTTQISYVNGWISVTVPTSKVTEWAGSNAVGIEATHQGVAIAIEKDWNCLHGDPVENVDTFPNPTAAQD
jgi:hypothetical protein